MEIKRFLRGGLVPGALLHAALVLAALTLGYNTYKEFVKEFMPFADSTKDAIKGTFPWIMTLSTALYILFFTQKRSKGIILGPLGYAAVIVLQAAITNLLLNSSTRDVVIPVNLATIYFAAIIAAVLGLKAMIKVELKPPDSSEWLPPALERFLRAKLPPLIDYIKKRPSSSLIGGFTLLLAFSALLLLFKEERLAEALAEVSYFMLLIGLGMEIYGLLKHGKEESE